MRLALIGAGNLGQALIQGLVGSGFCSAADIGVVCRTEEAAARLSSQLGVRASTDVASGVRGASWVILALRPRDFASVAGALKSALEQTQSVLSVMGGISLAHLVGELGLGSTARALPSLSVVTRKGVVPWTGAPTLAPSRRAELRTLLGALGTALEIEDEKQLDLSASIGACALAYHFEMLQGLITAGTALGCTPEQCQTIVEQTLIGTAALLESGSPLRTTSAVAHPGGATHHALQVLHRGEFDALIGRAVTAAAERLRDISRQFAPSPFP